MQKSTSWAVGVVGAEVVGVGRRHERHAELLGDVGRDRRALVLQVEAVVLDLDVEVVPEDLARTTSRASRPRACLSVEDELVELAGQAARSGR